MFIFNVFIPIKLKKEIKKAKKKNNKNKYY